MLPPLKASESRCYLVVFTVKPMRGPLTTASWPRRHRNLSPRGGNVYTAIRVVSPTLILSIQKTNLLGVWIS